MTKATLKNFEFRDIILSPSDSLAMFKTVDGNLFLVPDNLQEETVQLYEKAIKRLYETHSESGYVEHDDAGYRIMCPVWPHNGRMDIPFEDWESSAYPVLYMRKQIYRGSTPSSLQYPVHFINKIMSARSGLVIFAGGQGSGKTTGAVAFLESWLRRHGGTGATLEDPIEIPLPKFFAVEKDNEGGKAAFIQQIDISNREEASDRLENTFSSGVRRAFRMGSPNILLFGELRTSESAFALLNMALTNCLVLTTIHGTDLIQSLKRFFIFCRQQESPEVVQSAMSQAFLGCIFQKLNVDANGVAQPTFDTLLTDARVQGALFAGEIHGLQNAVVEQAYRLNPRRK